MKTTNKDNILLDYDDKNNPFIKYKHLIYIFIFAFALGLFADWARILHLSFSFYFVLVSVLLKIITAIAFIHKLFNDDKTRAFLNR